MGVRPCRPHDSEANGIAERRDDERRSISNPMHHPAALELAHTTARRPRPTNAHDGEYRDPSVKDAALGVSEDVAS